MSLDYNLEESIIKTYRGWDSFEKKTSNSLYNRPLVKEQIDEIFNDI